MLLFMFSYYDLYLIDPVIDTSTTSPASTIGDYSIGVEQLASMTRDHDFSALQEYGGASQLRICFHYFKFSWFSMSSINVPNVHF